MPFCRHRDKRHSLCLRASFSWEEGYSGSFSIVQITADIARILRGIDQREEGKGPGG